MPGMRRWDVEMVQNVRRIGRLSESNNPVSRLEWDNIQKAARSLRIEAYQLDVRRTEDFGRAFELAVSQRADALIVGIDDIVQANMPIVIGLTARHRLPAIYSSREYVEAGGLMSFGVNYPDLYRRVAVYVDRIFKGTKPSDLPIEQPTRWNSSSTIRLPRRSASTCRLHYSPARTR